MAASTRAHHRLNELAGFASAAVAAARAGLMNVEVSERDLFIGGKPLIRLRAVAGPFADRLFRPFGCCARAPGNTTPPFEVLCVHDDAAGGPPPAPPWGPDDYERVDAIAGIPDGPIHVGFAVEQQVFTLASLEDGAGVYWARDPTRLRALELGYLLRNILNRALRPEAMMFVHAAAVGIGGGGVLLAGLSGSGKSTTALACMTQGFQLAGDDFLCLSPAPQPAAHSVYGTVKLTAEGCELFPGLAARAAGVVDDKTLIVLEPEWMADRLNLKAIVLPRLGNYASQRVVACSAAQALLNLGEATIVLPPAERVRGLKTLSAMIRTLPVYRLDIGAGDLAAPAIALRRLLEDR